jgi:hypothetical protein
MKMNIEEENMTKKRMRKLIIKDEDEMKEKYGKKKHLNYT